MLDHEEETAEVFYDRVLVVTRSAIKIDTGEKVSLDIWVPRSVILDDEIPEPDSGPGTLTVKEWWATKHGFT